MIGPPPITRRAFLRGLAAAPGALLLACEADLGALSPGPEPTFQVTAPRAPPRVDCAPTSPDLLGPYYAPGAPSEVRLADAADAGDPFVLVLDVRAPDCLPPGPGAVVELWQADAHGAYHDDRFRTRLPVPSDGRVAIETIVPGPYLQATGWRPAHVHLRLTRPGAAPFITQLYFAGDPHLGPADSCTTCDSADPARHLVLRRASDGRAWAGARIVV